MATLPPLRQMISALIGTPSVSSVVPAHDTGNRAVIELLATVIEHLVKGEVIQMKGVRLKGGADSSAFDLYLRKNYYKTGSLMANSCRASSLLQEDVPVSREAQDAAFVYGRGVGAAFFQLTL